MKAWLSDQAIPYTVRNVVDDPAALAEFNARGYLLPPVTVINGVAVAGYQPTRMQALIDAALAEVET